MLQMQLPCCQIPFELYCVPLKPWNVKSVEYHKFSNRFIVTKQCCVSFDNLSISKKTSIRLAMSCFRSCKPQYTHSALKYFISSACLRPEQSLPSTSHLNVNFLSDSASRFLLKRFYTDSVRDSKAFNRSGADFGKRGRKGEKLGMVLEAKAKNTSELVRGESVVCAGEALGCSLISSFAPGCASSTEVGSGAAAEVMFKGESNEANGLKQAQALTALETALGTPFSNSPQVPPPKPLVIVISGPSGVGKDAVIKRLQEVRREFHFVVTATTRPKRPGEVDGIDYYFVTKDEFQKLIDDKELLEFALVYGDYKGIPKQQVRDCISKGLDVVLRVDVQGAATIRSILGLNAVFIFLVAESEVALVQRLAQRKTESIDKMVLRIATAREELKRLQEFDYVVVNADGQLEKTVKTICCIIDAEKARVLQRTVII